MHMSELQIKAGGKVLPRRERCMEHILLHAMVNACHVHVCVYVWVCVWVVSEDTSVIRPDSKPNS